MGTKSCKSCHRKKALAEFVPNTRAKDGVMGVCRKCFGKTMSKARWGPDRKTRKPAKRRAVKRTAASKKITRAQQALAMVNDRMPDPTDHDLLMMLKGAALLEGVPVVEMMRSMYASYRRGKR